MRNGLSPFRSQAADGGIPKNARHFPVVKMPRALARGASFNTIIWNGFFNVTDVEKCSHG
jgi:hypothetical protein